MFVNRRGRKKRKSMSLPQQSVLLTAATALILVTMKASTTTAIRVGGAGGLLPGFSIKRHHVASPSGHAGQYSSYAPPMAAVRGPTSYLTHSTGMLPFFSHGVLSPRAPTSSSSSSSPFRSAMMPIPANTVTFYRTTLPRGSGPAGMPVPQPQLRPPPPPPHPHPHHHQHHHHHQQQQHYPYGQQQQQQHYPLYGTRSSAPAPAVAMSVPPPYYHRPSDTPQQPVVFHTKRRRRRPPSVVIMEEVDESREQPIIIRRKQKKSHTRRRPSTTERPSAVAASSSSSSSSEVSPALIKILRGPGNADNEPDPFGTRYRLAGTYHLDKNGQLIGMASSHRASQDLDDSHSDESLNFD